MVSKPEYRWDFIGLSTQSKPLPATSENVTDGSTFYEADTSKLYIFYKTQWYEKTATGGGGGYELPIASASTLGGVKIGEGLTIDAETGVLSSSGGGGGPTVVQTAGTSTTDVMSQNATTDMVYTSSGTGIKIGYCRAGTNHAIAIGYSDSTNAGNNSISIGEGATSRFYNISIGTGAQSPNNNAFGISLGRSAGTSVPSGISGYINLGAYSNATATGEMNIGTTDSTIGYNSTNYRLITGVYDPQSDHDAATKGYVDTLISALEARVAALE